MNPVFLSGDEITFTTQMVPDTGTPYVVTLESLVTEYGFFIPLDNDSFFILEFLRNGPLGISSPYNTIHGLFIRSNGSVIHYELVKRALDREIIVKSKNLPENETILFSENGAIICEETHPVHYGYGIRRAFGCVRKVERMATFALTLAEDIPHVIDAFMKTSKNQTAKYVMLKIPDIVKYLQENKPSREFTKMWTITLD